MATVTALLLKHLQVKNKSGFEWLCLCPYHEDTSPSFSVNIRKKLFICYACGAKGTMNQLLAHLGVNETVQDEEIALEELVGKIRKAEEVVRNTGVSEVGVPINHRCYSDSKKIVNFWNSQRGISLTAIAKYRLGYDPLTDQAIIPVMNHKSGLPIGIIRRNTGPAVDGGSPRYLYSKGMKISENVFGAYQASAHHANSTGKPVLVVTEGAVDAMSIYQLHSTATQRTYMGVAVLGSRISKEQALIVKGLGYEEIVIATDMDRAGRVAQTQIATMLKDLRCGSLVYKASWQLQRGKDLNELRTKFGADEVLQVLDNAVQNKISIHDAISPTAQKPPYGSTVTTTNSGLYKVTHSQLGGYERYLKS